MFSRLFKRRRKTVEEERRGPTVNEGVFYLYLIITLQVVFVFVLLGVIMFIGQILATPLWVFVFALLAGAAAFVYIYRKAKAQFRRIQEAIKSVNLSDRNYEISIMGGVLTMRVEQNPRRLLDAPPKRLIEAEPVETPAVR